MNIMFKGALLHTEGHSNSLSEWLSDRFGAFGVFFDEVILHALDEMLLVIPVLFLTYLFMEYIEHRASDKFRGAMSKAGAAGPLFGAALGALPQCGFSSAAANLYTARVITLGTMVAAFLSTSDEMLMVMIGGGIEITTVLSIIIYKMAVGLLFGFGIDLAMRVLKIKKEEIDIDRICEQDNCGCQKGIFASALHHTVSVGLFVLVVSVAIGCAFFFIGEDKLSAIMPKIPVLSHLIGALVGLIPNCAVSVALTKLAMSGIISSGAMLSGLFSGAGVGLLMLLRLNGNKKENLVIMALLVAFGTVGGLVAELIPPLQV